MPSDAAVFGSEVVQLRHDHFGVGLSDSTSSTGDIIRALGFRAASLVAGLHIAGVSISAVLRVVNGLLDLRRCNRAAARTPFFQYPGSSGCTQLAPRSWCHGDGSALPSVWTLLAAVVVAGRSLFVLEERLAATFVTLAVAVDYLGCWAALFRCRLPRKF